MKNDVKLFINNELVDFSDELSMPFVYQLEDTNNPSIIKNSFTKTITIVGTKQNNKIFGDIYNFDREQLYDSAYLTGAYFNPSFRTPFSIYNNGELIENGYMQLNAITIKDKIINYEITLYGGIGDFFYNLSYNEDNEVLTLSDLVYGVKNDNGVEIESSKEFDFILDKEIIKKCWDGNGDAGTLYDYINFVPSYNGIYEDFDNNKAIINTKNNSVFTKTATTVDEKTYTTVNGYAFAEWENELTEWEVKDLRSYMQRPAIKLKKVIEACCDPANNGGYSVELDKTFFNTNNPYWEKSYIALPMFGSLISEDSGSITSDGIKPILYSVYNYIGSKNDVYNTAIGYYIDPTGTQWEDNVGGTFDTTDFNYNSVFTANIDLQIFFKGYTTKTLYPSILINGKSNGIKYNDYPIYQSIIAQIVVYNDVDLLPIAYSNIYNFTNKLPNGKYSNNTNWTSANISNSPYINVFGKFVYDYTKGCHYFKGDNGSNTFKIKIENVEKHNKLRFCLLIQRVSSDGYGTTNSRLWTTENGNAGSLDSVKANGYWDIGIFTDSTISASWDGKSIGTGFKVTKQMLLKTEKTPADYLLSYAKLFNLHFKKDIGSKKISILTRNNYFVDEIIDWSDRIDWSQDVKINPILFDKKFYVMDLDNPDNHYLQKYKNDYSVSYGQKRINTAYNFNNETQQLFDGNVFENSISVLDNSIYYRNFYNSAGRSIPSFSVEGIKYRLFKKEDGKYLTTDEEINDMADLSRTINWNKKTGYDIFAKMAFFNLDNGKKTLSDINSSLLFFNGKITPKDANGSIVYYWLTDDVAEMNDLNDGKPCYIYTESEYSTYNQRIAYKLSSLPQFLRYNIEDNTVVNSWDFAVPKESYIPNLNYGENTTIYNRFWGGFYEDQLNINTKKITCNVNLQGLIVNDELLRKFYWFGNSLWILNKIQDYDINSNKPTKCEFIKVQEQYSYLKPIGF